MLTKGKHDFGDIEGQRVTFVERCVSEDRREFLKKLLEHNGYEVIVAETARKKDTDPEGFDIAVTDMLFNPVIAVYQRKLRTFGGNRVTPDYWNQKTTEIEPNYWDWSKKEWWKKEQKEKEKAEEEARKLAEEADRKAKVEALAKKMEEIRAMGETTVETKEKGETENPAGLKGSLLSKKPVTPETQSEKLKSTFESEPKIESASEPESIFEEAIIVEIKEETITISESPAPPIEPPFAEIMDAPESENPAQEITKIEESKESTDADIDIEIG